MKNLNKKRRERDDLAMTERLIEEHKIEKVLRQSLLKAQSDEKAAYYSLMNHLKTKIPAVNDAYNHLKETHESPWEAREIWEQWAITTNK